MAKRSTIQTRWQSEDQRQGEMTVKMEFTYDELLEIFNRFMRADPVDPWMHPLIKAMADALEVMLVFKNAGHDPAYKPPGCESCD